MNQPSLGYPSSEMVGALAEAAGARGGDHKATVAAARTGCEELQKFLTTWPSWLFGRGDVAAGGAGDESPLVFNDTSLKAEATHHFNFNRGDAAAVAPAAAVRPDRARQGLPQRRVAVNPSALPESP